MKPGSRVAVATLGCKTNQFESAGMRERLERDGYILVPFEEEADIYVINTCTVTARTDAESRRLIRRARRRNPAAKVVATGCYAQVAPQELAALPDVDLVLGNPDKDNLASLLAKEPTAKVIVSPADGDSAVLKGEWHAEQTRAFLQVQNGCDSYCSYCIVPYARGRSRSVPFEDALQHVTTLAERGYREVVLTGIHLGAYGLDLSPRSSLLNLAREVEARRLVPRLRLGSVEPQEVTDDFIAFLAGSTIVCPHLHLPVQSGSGAVLERMNRRYDGAYVRSLIEKLVEQVPDVAVGADLIAGFPGETEAEFRETLELVEALPFAYLHVFPYSSRPGTKAAAMPGHLPAAVVHARALALREAGQRKKEMFAASMVGKKLRVLVQQRKDGKVSGLSRNYITVELSGTGAPVVNSEVTVAITAADGDHCLAASTSLK